MTTAIGAFPEPLTTQHHSHEPMSELYSYDWFAARARALHDEARLCADEANRIAGYYQWPEIDLDAIPPPELPAESTAGQDNVPHRPGGKHRRENLEPPARSPEPNPDSNPASEPRSLHELPSVEGTQVIPALNPD